MKKFTISLNLLQYCILEEIIESVLDTMSDNADTVRQGTGEFSVQFDECEIKALKEIFDQLRS